MLREYAQILAVFAAAGFLAVMPAVDLPQLPSISDEGPAVSAPLEKRPAVYAVLPSFMSFQLLDATWPKERYRVEDIRPAWGLLSLTIFVFVYLYLYDMSHTLILRGDLFW